MLMLREWNGDTLQPIFEMFRQFGVAKPAISILKYERLTPDSFIWIISSNEVRFCLYAEDFVPTLEHVAKAMEEHGSLNEESDAYELLSAKVPISWDKSSPVAVSDKYIPPKNSEEFMKYAVPSGYDFVFLGKSLK